MNRKDLMALPEAEMIAEMEGLHYSNMQNFETYSSAVKYAQEIVKPAKLGYDFVTKCPYRTCGSEDIRIFKRMRGAFVYYCNHCSHVFKILQEGDVYYYDIGKEEWHNANMQLRPSYFTEKYK